MTTGKLFVLSGPSGVGKGTVVRRLLRLMPSLVNSVSCTTRPPRDGEVDGRDYRFLSRESFDRLVGEGAFLEWAEVFGHRYGTLRAPVEEEVDRGRNVILELDIQGAAMVKKRAPRAVLVFLVPPSHEELARRLQRRRTEAGAELERRLDAARAEIAEARWFDHVVVNDEVNRVAEELASIIAGEAAPRPPVSGPEGGISAHDRAEDR